MWNGGLSGEGLGDGKMKAGDLIRFKHSELKEPDTYLVLEKTMYGREPMWKLLAPDERIVYIYVSNEKNCEVVNENR